MLSKLKNKALALVVLATASVSAFAQGTDPFDAVVTNVTTKVTDYSGELVILAGVGVVFMIAIKYVKKIRGAA
ncbi:MAG: hypothetical protein KIT86_09980 [Hydrogenophaga sp.]|uniref:hypothetical protein n=1 Tax=Hydrogenophaga sp. TaxID=1904254 RepID=UPI0026088BA0|nr:hypothetical protein [Hydrogenophaga sp.]MCW5669981.1 hypothetical protein [Hydrogenophaga sp.]